MRKLDRRYQLITPSLYELQRGLAEVAGELDLRGVEYHGRKLRGGPLLNAIVLHFLTLAPGEKERIAREYLVRLDELLSRDQPMRPDQLGGGGDDGTHGRRDGTPVARKRRA